ncbi:MAG: hypothetical protein ABR607_15900 [Pyrinomonadaceae bacterium]
MKKVIVSMCVLMVLSTATFAQTRARTARRGTQSSKTAKSTTAASQVKLDGATRIGEQVKNLTRFLYILGGVAKGIEDVDTAARNNQASPAALQTNAQNKAVVKNSLENVRVGLDQLEIYFRSTPELQGYYVKLVGSASGAADAEAQAAAGQFDQSGRTLLGVVNRLADVLVLIR